MDKTTPLGAEPKPSAKRILNLLKNITLILPKRFITFNYKIKLFMQGGWGSGRFKNLGQRFLENLTALKATTANEWKNFYPFFVSSDKKGRIVRQSLTEFGVWGETPQRFLRDGVPYRGF